MTASSRALLIALFALSIAAAGPAEARRLFVPDQHKTIQSAIDAAAKGDTIWVASGVYRGTIYLRKPLVLFGVGGPDSTILDGGDSVRVLHIEGVTGAAIVGFTIRRGKAPAGGGIYCLRDTSLMIASCKLEKNWESGLAAWSCGDLNLRELRIIENQGSGVWFNSSRGIFMICSFEKNKGYAGGGVSLVNSEVFLPMRQCSFEGNEAETTGGAINADSSDCLIAECVFRDNSALVAGGAVASVEGSHVAISRARFSGNHAKTSGAIHCDKSDVNIGYCVLDRNRTIALGAAIGYVGRAMANINPIIANNTFYKNTAEPEQEGATIFAERVSPEIRKNIIVIEGDQKAAGGIQSSPLYQCNLLFDPTGVGLSSLPSTETLVGDPLFCDPEHEDFYLRDLSPAWLATCGPIGALGKRCTSFKMVPSR